MKHGIPPHDTINRVVSMLNPHHFERLFMDRTDSLKDSGAAEKVIAVDGKTVIKYQRKNVFI
ncbi:Transposase [Bacteroidales bacterium Barb6XT]|nr:Transposase [Bacteroidales bacterium Barb6XT]